jgi:hypothetical protein
MTPARAELRVRGRLTPRFASALEPLRGRMAAETTLLVPDDAGVDAAIGALTARGCDVLEVRRVDVPPPRPPHR